jgi:hypothetical protein
MHPGKGSKCHNPDLSFGCLTKKQQKREVAKMDEAEKIVTRETVENLMDDRSLLGMRAT